MHHHNPPHGPSVLTDLMIKRRLLKFLRFHFIPYELDNGNILLGSAICNIANGEVCFYFPFIGKFYDKHINFKIEWTDPYNFYIRATRMHNQLMVAFPEAKKRFLPDLFD